MNPLAPTRKGSVAASPHSVASKRASGATIDDTPLPEAYVAFRNAIESELTYRHNVAEYARRIGYCARTVTCACQQATSQTAKRVLDGRLVLEATRLLVHTDTPAATISADLGFSEQPLSPSSSSATPRRRPLVSEACIAPPHELRGAVRASPGGQGRVLEVCPWQTLWPGKSAGDAFSATRWATAGPG